MDSISKSGETIQIAYFSEKKLKIDTLNFDRVLDKVGSRPMAIISINGPMRSGKSYILNHFIRYLMTYEETDGSPGNDWFFKKLDTEFHWENSSERQTTGINMWSEPYIVKRGDEEIAVLLMDTQGCFDDKTTNHENALIFALSCLLSSTLIYNVPKQLTEDVLQFLQMFVGYARMSDDPSHPQSFSKLIFLIRDWDVPREYRFGYYDDSTSAGPKNYKREKLQVKDDSIAEVKIVRQEILSSFTNVGCCLMPYPGKGLAMYDDVEKVDSDFADAIIDFVPRIFGKNIVTKKIGSKENTSEELKGIVKLWAEYYAKTTIPEPKSIIESTAEFQNNSAYSIAWKHYRNEMGKFETGLSQDEYDEIHTKIERESFEIFERMGRVKHDDIQKKFSVLLTEAINGLSNTYKQINVTRVNFEKLKTESKEEREKMKTDMEKEIERIKSMGTSSLESGINKILGLGIGTLSATAAFVGRSLSSGDATTAFKEAGQVFDGVLKNFGWKK